MTTQITTTQSDIHLTTNKDGVVMTTTTEVAEIFGRQHKNIIKAVENIECSEGFASANFSADVQTIATHNGGTRKIKYYNLTKDGFVFLAMGFNGKKAAQFKELYINEFNRMESRLKQQRREVELNNIQYRQGSWISTSEISELFDIDNGTIVEIAKQLNNFLEDKPPWNSMGVNIVDLDHKTLCLNLPAFLLLDLGNSTETLKQRFRVVEAFKEAEREGRSDEQQEKDEITEERKQDIADFKYAINRVNELGEILIGDVEWRNDLADNSKSNTISVAIGMLDSAIKNSNSTKTKQEISNVRHLLANTQQYEKHINRELLERLLLLTIQLGSLQTSSITQEIVDEADPIVH